MSRSDSQAITTTGRKEADTNNQNSQNSYALAQQEISQEQQDVNDFGQQLQEYAANNPYVQGGQFETDQDRISADTAGGVAQAAASALSGAARRGGMNPGAAQAEAASIADQAQRTMAGEQAKSDAERLGAGTKYTQSELQGQEELAGQRGKLAGQEGALYSTAGQLSNEELATAQKASAANSSFMDQFGGAFATGLGSFAAKGLEKGFLGKS